jgi:GDP/UDP-N,N'-diacetylbacillosamine 2-epimerase (hydrolysing)
MKSIGILTSSRADYGIYLPLMQTLEESDKFMLSIIAFGTHMSPYHDYSLNQIRKDGFKVDFTINSMLLHDDPNAISSAVGLTMIKFAEFWRDHYKKFDIVFCLGDRYEMFAAVYSGIPFGIKFAHIHGGETTLGAIDNIYRHAISLASKIHFTSTQEYGNKVKEITKSQNVHVCGSLSLENIKNIELYSQEEFKKIWGIDIRIPSILITIHPETVNISKNIQNLKCCLEVFTELQKEFQLIITMPNADTEGTQFRNGFIEFQSKHQQKVYLIENFGTRGYFTCMKYAKLLLGNSSSGIIEAASFKKYVINLGVRQKGRLHGENVYTIPFNKRMILSKVKAIINKGKFKEKNIYYKGGAVKKIINILSNELSV